MMRDGALLLLLWWCTAAHGSAGRVASEPVGHRSLATMAAGGRMTARKFVSFALVGLLLGCTDPAGTTPRYELRWCANGEKDCVLTRDSSASYVRGGFFAALDRCNDAIRHVSFYGAKLGGTCVEITESERQKLDGR
jgi:hypothetical protein